MRPSPITQQDHIEIKPASKLIVVRQDRFSTEDLNVFLKTPTGSYPVMDYSSFGVAVFTSAPLEGEDLRGHFIVQNVDLGEIELKKVRSEEGYFEGKSGIKSGYLVVGNPISVEATKAVIVTNQVLAEHASLFIPDGVPEAFKLITYEVRNWLSRLEEKVSRLEKNSFEHNQFFLDSYENVVCGIVAQYIEDNVYPLYGKLEEIVKGLDSKSIKKCYQFFRDSCGQFMFQSSYANRAYTKPRGYAGDFEMMKSVYGSEKRGATLFGRCMERYFIEVPESQAVRNRGRYLLGKIISVLAGPQRHQKILSVACGPAMEVQYLFAEHPELVHEHLEFHFVDQDTEALKECQRKIESIAREKKIKAKLFFHNWAIKNIIESGLPANGFDLIYTAGLFDYLSDAVAQYAAKQLHLGLSHKGSLVIGNFDISAPNRFGLSLVTDWHLIYRSEEDLRRLFGQLGEIAMERESLGINLFAAIEKVSA